LKREAEPMSDNCYLWLKANGMDVPGESTVSSMGRGNTIECWKFEHMVNTARESGSGMGTGRRVHTPVVLSKRIDKSTPLLYKALSQNEQVDAVIRFYRPSLAGAGVDENFYTIELKSGRISQIKSLLPDAFDEHSGPMMEEVSIVYQTIIWTYTEGGITHMDEWV
jgi:type VI secretion system secreted protein Hcp